MRLDVMSVGVAGITTAGVHSTLVLNGDNLFLVIVFFNMFQAQLSLPSFWGR